VRERATQLRDAYLARAALRSWVAAVVGREPAERGMAFVVDRLEAEAIAGGPPTDEDLAPYRAAADVALLDFLHPRENVVGSTGNPRLTRYRQHGRTEMDAREEPRAHRCVRNFYD
jgi:hypothetical protein